MTTNDNKALVRRFVEEFMNKSNLDIADELWDPDYKWYPASDPEPMDYGTHKRDFPDLRKIFPDLHVTVEQQLAEGDLVATRCTLRGTHQGEMRTPLGTYPGSGKQAEWTTISIHRIRNGKIVEGWIVYDPMHISQQLGQIPWWPEGPGSAKPSHAYSHP